MLTASRKKGNVFVILIGITILFFGLSWVFKQLGALAESDILLGVGGLTGFLTILVVLWIVFVALVKHPVGAFILSVIADVIITYLMK